MKAILNIIKLFITIFVILFALYALNANFSIFGSYRSFVVQSGSMEPAISTGDVIIVKEEEDYFVNDVITFYNKEDMIITHRVVDITVGSEKELYTKGDANRTSDENHILPDQVIGKVTFIIPRLGYLMSFAKSKLGLIILIIIPAILYIFDELLKIAKNARQEH